jgi:hypothetical protein
VHNTVLKEQNVILENFQSSEVLSTPELIPGDRFGLNLT